MCGAAGAEEPAEGKGDGFVKNRRQRTKKQDGASTMKGGVGVLQVIGEHRALVSARASLSIGSFGCTAAPHIPEGRA